MPVGCLLERVSCTQHKHLFHVPANNLEADGKPVDCLPSGQRQRRMTAHVKRRRKAQARCGRRRRTAGRSHVDEPGGSDVHRRNDQQIDVAKERVEAPPKIIPPYQYFDDRRAVERATGFEQRGKDRPNRIGVTVCRILAVDGLSLRVGGLDAIDGTPVLDIKPVMKDFLPRGELREPPWAGELMRGYW